MKTFIPIIGMTWLSLWWSPDQLGQRYFDDGAFTDAAEAFHDPMWRGVAFYRAGNFEAAAQSFTRVRTADGYFNEGNAWVMLGKYDRAIKLYDQALAERPHWVEAMDNRSLAEARAKSLESHGEDRGQQEIGADKIVFDKGAQDQDSGEDTEVQGGRQMTAAAFQEMWLQQVTTKPADYLKAKFAYQLQSEEGGSE